MDGFDLLGVQAAGEETKKPALITFFLGVTVGAILIYVISKTVEARDEALRRVPRPMRYIPGPERLRGYIPAPKSTPQEAFAWEPTQEDAFPWLGTTQEAA
jgi:hypothetical protein